MDKAQFCKEISNWNNHRLLLWYALKSTKGDVIELGCGEGSTPFLDKYCQDNNRQLFSYDYNEDWASRYDAIHVKDWSTFDWDKEYSVALVDESPGEQRKESIMKLKSEIIVVHDSEPKGWNSSDYKVRELFHLFKYAVDVKSLEFGGAWATALSNTIDVTKWIGESYKEHKIEECK
jgi:hypothetical protein